VKLHVARSFLQLIADKLLLIEDFFNLSVPSSDLSKIVLLGQKEKTTMTKNAFNYTSFYEESKL